MNPGWQDQRMAWLRHDCLLSGIIRQAVHPQGLLTSCVVQIEPEPMPTRSPSAPACINLAACAPVTTLPHTTCVSAPCVRLICCSMLIW